MANTEIKWFRTDYDSVFVSVGFMRILYINVCMYKMYVQNVCMYVCMYACMHACMYVCHVMSCHVMSCRVMKRNVCNAMSCHVM